MLKVLNLVLLGSVLCTQQYQKQDCEAASSSYTNRAVRPQVTGALWGSLVSVPSGRWTNKYNKEMKTAANTTRGPP